MIYSWNESDYQFVKEYNGIRIFLDPREEKFGCILPGNKAEWVPTLRTLKKRIDASLVDIVSKDKLKGEQVWVQTGRYENNSKGFKGTMTGKTKGEYKKLKDKWSRRTWVKSYPSFEVQDEDGDLHWCHPELIIRNMDFKLLDSAVKARAKKKELHDEMKKLEEHIEPFRTFCRKNSLLGILRAKVEDKQRR